MFPLAALAAPIIGGALGFAGQHDTNVANAEEAQRNRDFNAAEAEKNRQFQAGQSGSEVQRRVKDLEAAGLNPALAYNQSASSGSGSAASGTPARFDSSAGAGISSAHSASSMIQDMATASANRQEILARADATKAQGDRTRMLMDAELENLKARSSDASSAAHFRFLQGNNLLQMFPVEYAARAAQGRMFEANTASAQQGVRESGARTLLLGSQRGLTDVQRRLSEYEIPTAKNIAGAADSWFMKNIGPYLGSAKGVTDLLNPLSRFRR